MSKALQSLMIEELRKELGVLDACLLLDTTGLRVEEEREFRARLRKERVRLRRIKNSLAQQALEGTHLAGVVPHLRGPTTFAFGPEGVLGVPRAVAECSRRFNKKIALKGGFFEGEVLDQAGVEAFSRLPDRRALNGMILGALRATAGRLAGAVGGVAGALCRALQARIDKAGGAPAG